MAKRSQTEKKPTTTDVSVEPVEAHKEATGSEDWDLQLRMINQVHDTLCLHEGMNESRQKLYSDSVIPMLQGIKPTDEVEGMLATQMVATHNIAMECLGRAMSPKQSFQGWDLNLKHATKLLSIFSRQIEVLDKHRGKGQQKVTVEHIYIDSRVQAVVENIEIAKADGGSKKRGKPRTRAITNNPGEPINMDLEVSQTKPRQKS